MENLKERSSNKRNSTSYKKYRNIKSIKQNPKTVHNLYKSMRPDTFKMEKLKTNKIFTRDNFNGSNYNHHSVNVTPKYSGNNFASEVDPRNSPSPYTTNTKKRKILFPAKNRSIDTHQEAFPQSIQSSLVFPEGLQLQTRTPKVGNPFHFEDFQVLKSNFERPQKSPSSATKRKTK